MKLIQIILLILIMTPISFAQNIYCSDNSTLTVASVSSIDSVNYTKTSLFPCTTSCTNSTTPPSCVPGSIADFWTFAMLTVVAFVLMFSVYSPIVNIIGSLVLLTEGIFVITEGIEISSWLNLVGTASSYTMKTELTLMMGLVFIGLSLYKIAAAFSRTQVSQS